MNAYLLPMGFAAVVWLVIVVLNETKGLLSCDRFPNAASKVFAYLWMGFFFLLLAYLVTGSALAPATTKDLSATPFYSVFALHAILVVFLAGWWLATGRPDLREFLNVRYDRPLDVASIGVAAGAGGWVVTLTAAMIIALSLKAVGVIDEPPAPPQMIGWLAGLAIWKKALIVLSAMTVEEAFFRSFLQKRIGLLASTLLFALAHFTYGQPLLLIGVTVISIVIGITFYRTKNVLPGVIAHGVFDAIQIFVIVPIAMRVLGIGG